VTANQQNAVFNGRQLIKWAVYIGRKLFTKHGSLGKNTMQQGLEPNPVRVAEVFIFLNMGINSTRFPQILVTTDQPRVNALQGKFTRATTGTSVVHFIFINHSISYLSSSSSSKSSSSRSSSS